VRYRVTAWDIKPGDRLLRSRLHDRFGGNRQRGISPSRQSPNILLFSNPSAGARHGYADDLDSDPLLYCGEGQRGDQLLTAGNAAILKHRESRKTLRLFKVFGREVEYVGAFEVHLERPYFTAVAHQTDSDEVRDVVTFRLTPLRAEDGDPP